MRGLPRALRELDGRGDGDDLADVDVAHEARVEAEEVHERGVGRLQAEARVDDGHARREPREELAREAVGAEHGLGARLHVRLEYERHVEEDRAQERVGGERGRARRGDRATEEALDLLREADDVERRRQPHALVHDAHERARGRVRTVEVASKELDPVRPDLSLEALDHGRSDEVTGLLPRREEPVELREHVGERRLREGESARSSAITASSMPRKAARSLASSVATRVRDTEGVELGATIDAPVAVEDRSAVFIVTRCARTAFSALIA